MRVFPFGHFLDGNLHVMLAADVPLLPLHQAVEEILTASWANALA